MNNTTARDLFDELADDPFDNVSSTEDDALEKIKNDLSSLIEKIDTKDRRKQNGELVNEVKNFVRAELSKVKPTRNIIERQIEQVIKHVQVPVHIPPAPIPDPVQIIREIRVEVPKKDTRKLVEQSTLDKLIERIDELEKELKETRRRADSPLVIPGGPGGPGVIGVPPPEGHEGKFLKVVNGKWTYGAGGGGATVSGFTVSNPGSTTSLDASNTSLDELASIVAQVINQLQA